MCWRYAPGVVLSGTAGVAQKLRMDRDQQSSTVCCARSHRRQIFPKYFHVCHPKQPKWHELFCTLDLQFRKMGSVTASTAMEVFGVGPDCGVLATAARYIIPSNRSKIANTNIASPWPPNSTLTQPGNSQPVVLPVLSWWNSSVCRM